MAVKEMERVSVGKSGDSGAIYYENIEITSGESDVYLLPESRIYGIVCRQENGILNFTMDSEEVIDAATAVWEEWDGTSQINLGVTAFKFVWVSGTAKAAVTIRTEKE